MATRNRPHLLLDTAPAAAAFTPRGGGGSALEVPSPSNRSAHVAALTSGFTGAIEGGLARRSERGLVIAGAEAGLYLTFESVPGVAIKLTSLDPKSPGSQPELRAVSLRATPDGEVETAVVFVPDGKVSYFLSRLQQYESTLTNDRPRNRALLDTIARIGLATIESLWTDEQSEKPDPNETIWIEVWLRRRPGEIARFTSFSGRLQLVTGPDVLVLRDRVVLNVRSSLTELASGLDCIDDISELRRPHQPPNWLAEEANIEQIPWINDLVARTRVAGPDAPVIALLDTGVQWGHPLLAASVSATDCHVIDASWGNADIEGHGTQMAGISLYGDLGAALSSKAPLRLRHRLESVKVKPPTVQAQPPHVYGAITASAVASLEIANPSRARVHTLAVTTAQVSGSVPTAWSATIDALALGATVDSSPTGISVLDEGTDRTPRLFIVSAGNVRRPYELDHLSRSDKEPIEDPAQAWNALTVGAYTALDDMSKAPPAMAGYEVVAIPGELSPHSRTSRTWPPASVIKPDVVFEGGNTVVDSTGVLIDTCSAVEVLTTNRQTAGTTRALTTAAGTSPAAAAAAHVAATVMTDYPNLWPETIRALIVQSARWTPQMQRQLDATSTKVEKAQILRRYGMGVPDVFRATRSASDSLTLLVQGAITPYTKLGSLREMHTYALPWPTEELAALGAIRVEMRVTLSYFVEPNPSRRGWMGRYSYASHGLRFDVRRATESSDEMHVRLNKQAARLEAGAATAASDGNQWVLGPKQRVRGSVHSDVWSGTAADLAARGEIAVYPVGGWWKEASGIDRDTRNVRYSVVVSIETPDVDVDLWAPVAAQVAVPIDIEL